LLKVTKSRHDVLENWRAPLSRFFESRTRTLPAEMATSTQFVPPEALLIFHVGADEVVESDMLEIPFVVLHQARRSR
jgi:hypothetical protein